MTDPAERMAACVAELLRKNDGPESTAGIHATGPVVVVVEPIPDAPAGTKIRDALVYVIEVHTIRRTPPI